MPEALERKAYLLRYFEDYMAKTLRRDVSWTFEDVERRKNMDFLVKYYRMKSAIVFKMSNDVLQVRRACVHCGQARAILTLRLAGS